MLTTHSGVTHSLAVENPLGHSSRPLNEPMLVAKFLQCASLAKYPLRTEQHECLIAAVLKLSGYGRLDKGLFALLSAQH